MQNVQVALLYKHGRAFSYYIGIDADTDKIGKSSMIFVLIGNFYSLSLKSVYDKETQSMKGHLTTQS